MADELSLGIGVNNKPLKPHCKPELSMADDSQIHKQEFSYLTHRCHINRCSERILLTHIGVKRR